MEFKTSIVIPVFNNPELLANLLRGILKHEPDNFDEIVIVDDFSDLPEMADYISSWREGDERIRVIENGKNLGFTLSSNKGLREAYREVGDRRSVFLISSDVTINGKFIDQSNDILFGARRTLVGHKLLFGNTGWNTFEGKTFEYLEGYFLAATSDGWKDLGYFDNNYAPNDFEDVDLSTTAKSKGYRLVPLNNPLIYHQGGGTIGYSAEREAITNRNREYFKRKWVKL